MVNQLASKQYGEIDRKSSTFGIYLPTSTSKGIERYPVRIASPTSKRLASIVSDDTHTKDSHRKSVSINDGRTSPGKRTPSVSGMSKTNTLSRRESAAMNRRESAAMNRRESAAMNRRESAAMNRRESAAINRRESTAINRRDSTSGRKMTLTNTLVIFRICKD